MLISIWIVEINIFGMNPPLIIRFAHQILFIMETTELKAGQLAKIARQRSVAYPSQTIERCLELVTKIKTHFGFVSYTPREAMVDPLGISDSHLQGQLSSCVQYGLLEMKVKEGYKPTALFQKIHKPIPSENPLDGKKECLSSPDLYKALLTEYANSSLPSLEGLSAILSRNHKVTEAASVVAARIFLENLADLELVTLDNILSLNGGYTPYVEVAAQTIQITPETPMLNPPTPQKDLLLDKPEDMLAIPIPLPNGRKGVLYMPDGSASDDFRKASRIIEAYAD